ncbi:MAG: heme NO-binding domain-containing protein [Candidatus Thiodiazotropha endolucinida]
MKGLVFSEFIEFVEGRFSPELADEMLDNSDLPSQGAYTSVGTYDHQELLTLVTTLSRLTETPVAGLLQSYGNHLFERLLSGHPGFLDGVTCSFDFMQNIEDYIHVEVRKLYPDAELPRFEWQRPADDHLVLTYHSRRPFADLAAGLIDGCVGHFNEQVRIDRQDLGTAEENVVCFDLVRSR